MRRCLHLAAAVLLASGLWIAGAVTNRPPKKTSASQTRPKKKPKKKRAQNMRMRRYPPPRVSAAVRTQSLQRVSLQLEARPDPTLEQPGALVPFFEQLYRMSSLPGAAASERPAQVHIVHFGDSHTAADEWTGGLRDAFQARFGDAGAGFSLAGYPFKGYRRYGVRSGATRGWDAEGLRSGAGDGYFGLGGVSVATERAGQSIFLEADCDSVELDYLQQPGGGEIELSDNGESVKRVSTSGATAPGFLEYQTAPGRHRFEVRTLDHAPVRLFGWVTQKDKGITYESIGINGAEAGLIMRWDEAMHAAYLQRRDPALVVLAYGTNEAGDANWNESRYQAMFSSLLQRIRRAVPAASILVVGPGDRFYRTGRKWKQFESVGPIIAAQQEACRENRCAFWNTRERMGGDGAMYQWVMAGLGQGDYVHFTSLGYQRLAAVLFQDIMRQYENYLKVRQEVSTQPTDEQASQNP